MISPYVQSLAKSCLIYGRYSIGGNSCFSIHTNFSGSWLESNEECKLRGGNLWQVQSGKEWAEVMRSSVSRWYKGDCNCPIDFKYDGRINAVKLLDSLSVMHLGLPDQVSSVKNISFNYFFCSFMKSVKYLVYVMPCYLTEAWPKFSMWPGTKGLSSLDAQ